MSESPAVSLRASSCPPAPVARFYRPELDWLRFLAFSAVFWFHVCPPDIESYWNLGLPRPFVDVLMPFIRVGGHGVDLFFTLSAYLITELLLLERNRTGRIHVKAFYVRRILRIWPLYFAFVLTAFPYEVLRGEVPALYYATLATFTANWYRVSLGMISSITGPLWSVSIEEQFYLVWPNLMARIKPRHFAGFLALLVAATWVYRYCYVHGGPPTRYSVWYNTFARMDCFAMGGLLACALHGRRAVLTRAPRIGMMVIAALLFWHVGASPTGGYFETSAVWAYSQSAFASVLLILAAITAPARETYSTPFRALSYLGKISYGLYVFHFAGGLAAYHLAPGCLAGSPWLWVWKAAVAGVITLVLSMASYRFLEKPFLRLKEKFAFVKSRPA